MSIELAAVVLLMVVAQGGMIWTISRRADPVQPPDLGPLAARLGTLEAKVEGLPAVWELQAEAAREAARNEYRHAQRAAEAERRTAAMLGEGDDDDDEPEGPPARVPQVHAPSRPAEGMQPVPAGMGHDLAEAYALAHAQGVY